MKQRFYLITGVMASGKSTTAQALAQALPRCVHLRGDLFRRMIVTGREEMADPPTEEGAAAAAPPLPAGGPAARGYWEAGFSVVLQDNYYGPALEEMASLLRASPCAWWSSALLWRRSGPGRLPGGRGAMWAFP